MLQMAVLHLLKTIISQIMNNKKGILQMPFLYVQILMTLNFENRMEDFYEKQKHIKVQLANVCGNPT